MNTRTKKLVTAALMAAIVCIATMIIKIPSPLKGYLNFGDCMVLASGWMLSPGYAFLAAGIGSALADLFSSYFVYAPATFLIKGLMALVAFYGFKILKKSLKKTPSRIISGFFAETIMVVGYYIFEGFLYGFVSSIVNIPANALQGVAGIIMGVVLVNLLDKSKIL